MEELFMLLFVVDINVGVDNMLMMIVMIVIIIKRMGLGFLGKGGREEEMITKGDFMGAFWELFITYLQLVVTIEQKTTTMPLLKTKKRHNKTRTNYKTSILVVE